LNLLFRISENLSRAVREECRLRASEDKDLGEEEYLDPRERRYEEEKIT
jgi:hypothetical protein